MIKIDRCEICGTIEEGAIIAPYTTAIGKPEGQVDFGFATLPVSQVITYSQCLSCGLVWQNPRMSDEELGRYYGDGHYRKGMNMIDTDRDERERSERILNDIDFTPTSHLDMGCSRGYLLQMTHNLYNCNIQGVDSNPEYAVAGVPVVRTLSKVEGTFDLITAIHYLEHVASPWIELIFLSYRLQKRGKLIIEVPSKDSRGGPLRLAHTYFFEPWVLIHMAKMAGLQVLSLTKKEHTQIILENQ